VTFTRRADGHVLLAALTMVMIFSLLGLTSIFLAGQDRMGVAAMNEEQLAQQLGEAASELVVGWFHDERTVPPSLAAALSKRQGDSVSGPMFWDAAGRSQFIGTADHPDVLLDAESVADDRYLNHAPSGFPEPLKNRGRFTRLAIYKPQRLGLLGTIEVTARTAGQKAMNKTLSFQLGALALPAIRSPLQVGQSLGLPQPGQESSVRTHWGSQRIGGSLAVRRLDDVVTKTAAAPVVGLSYDHMEQREDRWTDYWVGGTWYVTSPPPGQSHNPTPKANVHLQQVPSPGVRLDQWPYEDLKRVALRHGTYYRLDRQGRLHEAHSDQQDEGMSPSEVLRSAAVGDHRGLVFCDTIDGEPPRSDNLGTLTLETEYVEALLVVQGHVHLKPQGTGRSISILSPAPEGSTALGARVPVQLSRLHMNGLLWAAGTITVEESIAMFGAVYAGQTVLSVGDASLEVWYDANMGRGLFRGLPVVYRVPGTLTIR